MGPLDDKIKFSININKMVKGKLEKYSGFPDGWQVSTESKIDKKKDGLAVLTGEINNITVIDFDGEEGMVYYHKYLHLFKDTFIETSTRGFKHAYFKYEAEFTFKKAKCSKKIDILNNRMCSVMGKADNNNEIQTISQEFKDILMGNVKQSEDEFIVVDDDGEEEIKIKYEDVDKVKDLVKILTVEESDNFDIWVKVGMTLKNILEDEDEAYDIWTDFSKLSKKYNVKENKKKWKSFKLVENYGIGSLIYFVSNKKKLKEWNKKYPNKNIITNDEEEDEENLTYDFLLLKKLFGHAKENEYKRDEDGNIYKKIQSYAYKYFINAKNYINMVMKNDILYKKSHKSQDILLKFVLNYEIDDDFPFIKVNNDYIGFKNGMLNIITCEFLTIDEINKDEDLINIIARKYINQDFLYSTDTPLIDKVLKYQFEDEIVEFQFAMFGRLWGIRDDWQVMMMNIGEANTGKSLILEVIKACINNIGYINSSFEKKFGLSNLYDKELILCDDLPIDFKDVVPQGDFLSMVSNGSLSCPVKNQKKAIQVLNWSVPILFSGNQSVNYLDMGNISRRILENRYNKIITNTDVSLKKKIIDNELPSFIYKSLLKYKKLLKYKDINVWEICPEQYLDDREDFRIEQNPFFNYLNLKTEYKEGSFQYFTNIKKGFSEWLGKDVKRLDKGTLTLFDDRYIIETIKNCKFCEAIYKDCECPNKNVRNRRNSTIIKNISYI